MTEELAEVPFDLPPAEKKSAQNGIHPAESFENAAPVTDPTVQKSPATRAQILNTCSFAINNLANACKTVGIVGLAKELKDAANTREGGWSPALQQQINVTIQNAVKGDVAKTAEPVPENVSTT